VGFRLPEPAAERVAAADRAVSARAQAAPAADSADPRATDRDMLWKPAMSRATRIGLLSLCALLMTAGSCWDEETPCKASSECAAGEICAGAGAGPYYCLVDCTESGTCAQGTCTGLTSADCPTCDVVTNAYLVNQPLNY
jgi:hypothetical protein